MIAAQPSQGSGKVQTVHQRAPQQQLSGCVQHTPRQVSWVCARAFPSPTQIHARSANAPGHAVQVTAVSAPIVASGGIGVSPVVASDRAGTGVSTRRRYSAPRPINGTPQNGGVVVLTHEAVSRVAQQAQSQTGLAAKAVACQRNATLNHNAAVAAAAAEGGSRAARRNSALESSHRRTAMGPRACERSLSVGICMTESCAASGAFPRGTSARSSSALPTIMTSEALAQKCGEQSNMLGNANVAGATVRSGAVSPQPGGFEMTQPIQLQLGCAAYAVSAGRLRKNTNPDIKDRLQVGSPANCAGVNDQSAVIGQQLDSCGGSSGSGCFGNQSPGTVVVATTGTVSTSATATTITETVAVSRNSFCEELEMFSGGERLCNLARSPGIDEPLQSAQVKNVDDTGMDMSVRLLPREIIYWNEISLIQPISTGSFGEVFLAKYQAREVSVKRCLLGENGTMTKEQLHNLEREINTYRTLDHPAIVKYIGCILEHPNLAIVTEYVPNGNVFDLLYLRRINLPAAIRLRIATTVGMAIQYMHSCDPVVIHRDLKTQNLVLDADYNVKLCDFGKTQALYSDFLPCDQDTGGSPRYMAPECFIPCGSITEKVDIWSLGCCLVEVFGGPLPYEEIPQMAQVKQIMLNEKQPPLVPPWFSPMIKPALAHCFEFDFHLRIGITGVILALKKLTAEELENYGMHRRRTV